MLENEWDIDVKYTGKESLKYVQMISRLHFAALSVLQTQKADLM